MKLVRDKTQDVLKDCELEFTRAPETRRETLLRQKLLEEVGELVTAETKENVLQECGDVIEVVLALAEARGLDRMAPFIEAVQKREGRGGYDKLVILEAKKRTSPTIPPPPSTRDYATFGGYGYSG